MHINFESTTIQLILNVVGLTVAVLCFLVSWKRKTEKKSAWQVPVVVAGGLFAYLHWMPRSSSILTNFIDGTSTETLVLIMLGGPLIVVVALLLIALR